MNICFKYKLQYKNKNFIQRYKIDETTIEKCYSEFEDMIDYNNITSLTVSIDTKEICNNSDKNYKILQLTKFPKNLEYLDITNCYLTNILTELPSSLKTFKASGNYLTKELDRLLETTPDIEILDISNQLDNETFKDEFLNVVDNLYKKEKLRSLNLSDNYIKFINSIQMENSLPYNSLEVLNISNCIFTDNLTYFDFRYFIKLKKLILNNVKLYSISFRPNKDIQLKELYANNCNMKNIEKIPKTVRHIEVKKNYLKELNFMNNTKIEYIDVSNNKLTILKLPYVDYNYRGLVRYLNCSNNNLKSLDTKNMYFLEYLDCSNNKIGINYDGSENLYLKKKIIFCNISNNNFSTVTIQEDNVLKHFYASNNKIVSIELHNLNDNIECIDLYNNDISYNHCFNNFGLSDFINLNYLKIGLNQINNIESLPPKLEYFYAESNNLLEIPTLPKTLIDINLYNNDLTKIDIEEKNYPSLKYLNIARNNIKKLPTIQNENIEYINFYQSIDNEQVEQ